MKRRLSSQRLLLIGILVSGTVIPLLLYILSTKLVATDLQNDGAMFFRTPTRRPLDFTFGAPSESELKYQVRELERIKLSVKNELRELEKERVKTVGDTETHKSTLYKLEKELATVKKDLLKEKALLVKVSQEVYAATKSPVTTSESHPPPIYVLPPVQSPSDTEQVPPKSRSSTTCSFETCFNFSRCPLSKPFKVYLYESDSQGNDLVSAHASSAWQNLKSYLKVAGSLTSNEAEACIFVVPVHFPSGGSSGPSAVLVKSFLFSLPYWNERGSNHILVSLSDQDSSRTNVFDGVDTKEALIAASFIPLQQFRTDFDIIIPMIFWTVDPMTSSKFQPHVPAQRKTYLYFSGQKSITMETQGLTKKFLDKLFDVVKHSESIAISTHCSGKSLHEPAYDDWELCVEEDRQSALADSTFTLVPALSKVHGIATFARLGEALKQGAVPVIITGALPLPLSNVLDWSEVGVLLPLGRIHELHLVLRTLSDDQILAYRRQGRFFWDSYFSSRSQILKTIVAILRKNSHHSPPLYPSINGKLSVVIPQNSPIIHQNFTISEYRLYGREMFNSPPGPFFTTLQTPWPSVPVSGSRYVGMSSSELQNLPPHIVQAGGITGPYFEQYLLGNIPEEFFTIVMLTYERYEVVQESVERLDGLLYLAKVIVVWNNPDTNPTKVNWPRISVPVEVIWTEKNSLNNRFLPYDRIETEAVLSIDDDVYLRHDEIQFAFRVWRESRDRLVGFPGRFHAYDVKHNSWLYNSNYTCELSMVLTGAAFLHKYYMHLYSQWMPKEIRDAVDQYLNCEDLAMNFLIAHITRKPPLKVTSRWTFRCPGCPETLSQSDEHFNERHVCINYFAKVYGYMPLLYTQFRLDSVLFKTRLPSHLEKCYQYV